MPATTLTENFGPLETSTKKKLLDKKKPWGVKNSPAGNPWKKPNDDEDEDDQPPKKDLGSVIFDALQHGKFANKKRKKQIAKGVDPFKAG